MATPYEEYVNRELPRRSALMTKAILGGYDADPNLPGAPAALQGAPLGTWYYEETADLWWRKISASATGWQRQNTGSGGIQPTDNIVWTGDHEFRGGILSPAGTVIGTTKLGAVTIGESSDYSVAIGDGSIAPNHIEAICIGRGSALANDDGTAAMGLITFDDGVIGNQFADGETITIDDGVLASPVVFELDSDGSVVETTFLRAFPYTVADDAATMAFALEAAVNASALSITAFAYDAGSRFDHTWVVELTHQLTGEVYNIPIDTTSAYLTGKIMGMDGGADPSQSLAAVVLTDALGAARSNGVVIGGADSGEGHWAGVGSVAIGWGAGEAPIDGPDPCANNVTIGSSARIVPGTSFGVQGAVALGWAASATSWDSIAIGDGATAGAPFTSNSVAIGPSAWALGGDDVAIGGGAVSNYSFGTAVGSTARVERAGSTAIGAFCRTPSAQSLAIGYDATGGYVGDPGVSAGRHIAIGYQAAGIGIPLGTNTDIGGTAIGFQAWGHNYGIGLGYEAHCNHTHAVAIGRSATTTADNQCVIGSAAYPMNTVIFGTATVQGAATIQGNATAEKDNTGGPTYMAAKNLVAGTGAAAAFFAQSDSAYIEFTAYSSTFNAGTIAGEAMADAIRVTDAASPAASKFLIGTVGAGPLHLITSNLKRITIDSAGLVGIRTAAPGDVLHVVSDNNVALGGQIIERAYSDPAAATAIFFRKARNTIASKQAVQVGDRVLGLVCSGWDGSAYVSGAIFNTEARTISSGICSQDFVWRQQPAAGGLLVETMRLTADAKLGIGVSPVTDLDITKSAAGAFVYSRVWNNNAAANSDAQAQVLSSGGNASLQLIDYDSGAKPWTIGVVRSANHRLYFGKSTSITGNLAISLDYDTEGRLGVNKGAPNYPLDVAGKTAISAGLGVWGATPPASQPAKINDPSGGTTIDTQARSAINAILDVLEGAGLSALV